MSSLSLEKRVTALEQEMAKIKAQQAIGSNPKDWRRTVGKFAQLQEIFSEAMKLRETDRKKARRKQRENIRAKS